MAERLNILIAGANGIIGQNITPALNSYGDVYKLGKSVSPGKKTYKIDLINKQLVDNLFSKDNYYDILVFLVGLAHSKGSKATEKLHMDCNYLSLVNCLESMKKYGKIPKKIIFSSTISVYGESFEKEIYKETCSLNPSSAYALSKKKAEDYLVNHYSDIAWILRYAPVYGHKFSLNIDRRTIMKNFNYRVGDGMNKLSLCNMKNITHVISEIFEEKIPPGKYNISDSIDYNYNDLLKYKNIDRIIILPRFLFFALKLIGELINSNFLKENSIKLISDNIYPSKKIRRFIDLPYTLK